jgi:hypothetical protein
VTAFVGSFFAQIFLMLCQITAQAVIQILPFHRPEDDAHGLKIRLVEVFFEDGLQRSERGFGNGILTARSRRGRLREQDAPHCGLPIDGRQPFG